MLNDTILSDYINTFYGYGSWKSNIWFIGMEEGGDHSEEQIATLLNRWDQLNRYELGDFGEIARSGGDSKWISGRPPLQPTWRALIRMILAVNNLSITNEAIRKYQKNTLGRHIADSCLLELMPLPCKSFGNSPWHYGEWSNLPYLKSRDAYSNAIVPKRVEGFKFWIDKYRP
jgi:hypothetical protein